MKRFALVLAALMIAAGIDTATAQQLTGAVTYSLPQTALNIRVTYTKTVFTPGPYAKFAQKYMGSAPRTAAGVSYSVKEIQIIPCIEADPAYRYSVVIPEKSYAATNFLNFSSQGLISVSGTYSGPVVNNCLSAIRGDDMFVGQDPMGNLAKVTTTLYKSQMTENGEFEKVPIQQSQTVEKSTEKKAEETAGLILNLRQKRLDIITGDTDATFSGEALHAALAEIDKLEKKYLSLFYGTNEIFEEQRVCTIVPKTGVKNYTVARMGSLSLSMELVPEELSYPSSDSSSKGRSGAVIHYRTPVAALCRITDGSQIVAEGRVLVYQLGENDSFPL